MTWKYIPEFKWLCGTMTLVIIGNLKNVFTFLIFLGSDNIANSSLLPHPWQCCHTKKDVLGIQWREGDWVAGEEKGKLFPLTYLEASQSPMGLFSYHKSKEKKVEGSFQMEKIGSGACHCPFLSPPHPTPTSRFCCLLPWICPTTLCYKLEEKELEEKQ